MPSPRPSRRSPRRAEPGRPTPSKGSPTTSAGSGADAGDRWEPDDGFIEGVDAPPEVVEGLSGAGVPAVVAVMAVRDPGTWFDEALAGLARQEYPGLSVLVIDHGSAEDPTARVAAALPSAYVAVRDGRVGWAEAVNSVLETVEGAPFLLICHDDTDLEAGAVQAMVEEAFRSNAGIVGAKLVDWSDPARLRSVGSSIDKFAFPAPMAEPGELDQSQHDAVRDAFFVSSAAMLIRADLFADLGGFSTDLGNVSADLDLCWRARVAGASVVVMPAARGRHREQSASGDVDTRRSREVLRTQGRLVIANYTPLHLLRIVPQAVALASLDLLVAVGGGRWSAAADICAAMWWNVVHLPRTLTRRGAVKRVRRVDDGHIRRMQVPGSVRITVMARALRRRTGERRREVIDDAKDQIDHGGSGGLVAVGILTLVMLLVIVGSRGLVFGKVAVVGDLGVIDGLRPLVRAWWHGWRAVGLGHEAATPGSTVLVSALSVAMLGQYGAVRLVLVVAPVLLGIWGAWRIGRRPAAPDAAAAPDLADENPVDHLSTRTRAAIAVAYAVNPLAYGAVAAGRLAPLALYAALPWVAAILLDQTSVAPFVAHRSTPRAVARAGLVVALCSAFAPISLLMVVCIALVIGVAASAGRSNEALRRVLTVASGAVVVAIASHLPWALSMGAQWRQAFGSLVGADRNAGWREVLGFATPAVGGVLGVGLSVAAAFAVLAGRGWRLRWATAAWAMAVGSWAAVSVASHLDATWTLPATSVLLAPATLGLAFATGLGVEAYDRDVRAGSFGWRQIVAGLAVAGFAVGSVPFLSAASDGRWRQPDTDAADVLQPLSIGSGSFRTLWLGDSGSLLGAPVPAGPPSGPVPRLAMVVTDAVVPSIDSLSTPVGGAGEQRVVSAIDLAVSGATSRLGHLLAPASIRWVVVATGHDVGSDDDLDRAGISSLLRSLDTQFDLERRDIVPGFRLYENASWLPTRGQLDGGARLPAQPQDGQSPLDLAALPSHPVLGEAERPVRFEGEIAEGSLVVTSNDEGDWTLRVGGAEVARSRVSRWAQSYAADHGGAAVLEHEPSGGHLLAVVLSLLVATMTIVVAVGAWPAPPSPRARSGGNR